MPELEDLKIGLALGMTITGLAILYYKMFDNDELRKRNEESLREAKKLAEQTGEDQQYIISSNPNLNIKKTFNWWGLFALLTFVVGICLFFI